jgi:DNA-binding NarL/FixJ family response regulator
MKKVKVLLADDQTVFIESLKMYIEKVSDQVEVVGLASNGQEALRFLETDKPDLILMDIRMPEIDGVDATREIHCRFPDIKILILTTFDDDEYVQNAIEHGAAGYLLKEDIDVYELIGDIKAVIRGSMLFSPQIATKLVKRRAESSPAEEKLPLWYYTLSKKEKKILGLMFQGCDNREISEKLFLGEQTIKNYISIIYSKLGTRNRIETVKKALEVERFL